MFKRLMPVLLLVVAVSIPSPSFASESTLKLDDIRTQQAEIRSGVQSRAGRYKDMDSDTRSELIRRQDRMLALIDGKQLPDELSPEHRTQVFNDLEWIEAAINRAEDDRMVCEYTRTIGSNRKTRVCRTAAQMREARERAREELDRVDVQMRRGG